MPKWWKTTHSKKAKYFPKSASTGIFDTIASADDQMKKKKSRSLTSLFSSGKTLKRQQISDNHLNRLRHKPVTSTTAMSKHDDYIIVDRPAMTSNLKSLASRQAQEFSIIGNTDDSSANHRQMLNNPDIYCFGFAVPSTTWSRCLYVTVILFLCTCLIISLSANLKK